jgi:retron-type reverse transcriptase
MAPPNTVPVPLRGQGLANTANGLWDELVDFENIYRGYLAAAKGKRYRNEVLAYKADLEDNLFSIIKDIKENTYKPLPLRQFWITDPKRRLISAPAFRDRIVHHSIVRIIEPIFEKRFIKESFACRVGFGTHAAMKHVHHCTQMARREWGEYYVLKCDITKFFPSVDHEILKKTIRRSIRDSRVLRLIDTIIDWYNSDNKYGIGIPIGALTSQLFANVYLDPLDHFLKEKCRVKYYARYMDDFVIISRDKLFLHELLKKTGVFLTGLKIRLNPKTEIFPGKHGIDFCGYRVWPTHIKPRKRTVKRAKKRMKKMAMLYRTNPKILEHAKMSLQSFLGYIMHCSGWKTTKSVLRQIVYLPGKRKPVDKKDE